MKIKLGKDQKLEIEKPEYIVPFIKGILKRENKIGRYREHFWVLGLSQNLKILFLDLLSLGKFRQKSIRIKEVFQEALKHSTPKIILLRYQPNYMPNIRKFDKKLFHRVKTMGRSLDIEIEDYMVLCETEYSSMKWHLSRTSPINEQ